MLAVYKKYSVAWAVVFIIYVRVFGDTSLTDNGNSSHAFIIFISVARELSTRNIQND